MKELLQRAKELEPELLENRRWLHRHPELGFELKETCTFVEEKLKAMGYAPQRMSKAGIVATVGKTGGKTILLRADMDALPMKEESGLDFPPPAMRRTPAGTTRTRPCCLPLPKC